MVGETLAHYKILKKIGSGGMGDVYLAEDTKLAREVALKVLPPELADSVDRRARFQQEAKAIAALNHPNIVTVHSVENANGIHFITMELVRGKTLAELLPKKGFVLEKFFDIAAPLADAVAAAHEANIVHRDLKPGNVMVTDDGRVKVLDFGLARTTAPIRVEGDSESPTALKTQEGVLAGTLHYMAPEQAEGKAVDHRTDTFALGVIFYEMLSGERPFGGDTAAAVLSSILKDEAPSLADSRADVPPSIVKVVSRCLSKDPRGRYQSALDLELDLLDARVAAPAMRPSRPETGRRVVFLLAATGLAALGGYLVGSRNAGVSTSRVPQLARPTQVTASVGVEAYPSWSPDGSRLLYHSNRSGNWDVWQVLVQGGEPVNMTEGLGTDELWPVWSPDGSQIAYSSEGSCYVMSALGGAPQNILSSQGRPAWSADGGELACVSGDDTGDYVEIMSLALRESRRIPLEVQLRSQSEIAWSGDGRHIAFIDSAERLSQTTELRLVRVDDGEVVAVTENPSAVRSPSWSADGRTLYFVSDEHGSSDLWQVGIGVDGTRVGPPEPVTTGIEATSASFSSDGARLAYSKGRMTANVWRVPLTQTREMAWLDAEQMTFDQAFVEYIDISSNGDNLYFSSDRGGNSDLWQLSISDGSLRQLTSDPRPDWDPKVSPDGRDVAFYSARSGNRDIWTLPLDGGPAHQVTQDESLDWQPSWSPDGRELAFISGRSGNFDVWIATMSGGEPRQLTTDPGSDNHVRWSPDGEWILFGSNRQRPTGRWRVPAAGGEPELLTSPAGYGCWSSDSQGIFFTTLDESRATAELAYYSIADGTQRILTDLKGKVGRVGRFALATDGQYLYFTWEEELGDIWVMDVVTTDGE